MPDEPKERHVGTPVPGTGRFGGTKPSDVSRLLANLQLGRFSGVFIFIGLIGLFSIWVPETFLTSATWKTIAQSQALTAILAMATLAPLAAGVFDLSIAQNMGFCTLVCGALMINEPHLGLVEAVIATLLVGAAVGALNGFLCGVLGLDSFIATLGTTSLITGLMAAIANGQYYGPFPDSLTKMTAGSVLGLPVLTVYLLALAVVAWYVLEHTPVGRRIHAAGANKDAARLAGVRVKRIVFWSFVVCGALAGLAGVLAASNLNSANESFGPQYLLPVYAAAFLGTTQIKPGRFNVWGTVLAIYLLGTGVQGLQLAGADLWVTYVFNGGALLIAISVALFLERYRGHREVVAAEAESHGGPGSSVGGPATALEG
jgi:ribose transport system permease protein